MCVHLCMFVHVCICTDTSSRAWWYVLVIPAFRRRMQKDLEFKATKRSFSKTKKSWQMNIDTIKMNFISIQLCHLSSYVIRIKIPRGKEVIKTVQWIKALVAQPDHLSSSLKAHAGVGGWGGATPGKLSDLLMVATAYALKHRGCQEDRKHHFNFKNQIYYFLRNTENKI